jgi:hypothetical protein
MRGVLGCELGCPEAAFLPQHYRREIIHETILLFATSLSFVVGVEIHLIWSRVASGVLVLGAMPLCTSSRCKPTVTVDRGKDAFDYDLTQFKCIRIARNFSRWFAMQVRLGPAMTVSLCDYNSGKDGKERGGRKEMSASSNLFDGIQLWSKMSAQRGTARRGDCARAEVATGEAAAPGPHSTALLSGTLHGTTLQPILASPRLLQLWHELRRNVSLEKRVDADYEDQKNT